MPPLIGTDPSFAAERRYRMEANDDAQIGLRTCLDSLKLVRARLTAISDSGADANVVAAADVAREELDNYEQTVEGALRIAVDASGLNEVHSTEAA